MNELFKHCVDLLVWMAAKLHITYEAINIWIFVIIEPVVFMILLWIIYKQHVVIKSLHHSISSIKE